MTASEPPADEGAPWRGLHPLSLVVNLLPQTWRTLRGAWPLLLVVFAGGPGLGTEAVDLSLLLLLFGLTLSRTMTHFFTLRYRVHQGRLEVRTGLLTRSARALDPARIQNIEIVQNLFHKAAGLVELRVETAGDASAAGLLSALSVEEARSLQAQLRALVEAARPEPAPAAGEEAPAALIEGSLIESIAYGLSRRTVGTVAVLTAVGLELLGRFGPAAADEARWVMQPRVFMPALMLAFAASWAWSAGRAVLQHWRFTLRPLGDRIVLEEGLTTRRRVEIPRAKVQLLRVDEPLLRRVMGYGTLLIETAALGVADGELRQAEGVVPMVPRDRLPELLQASAPAALGRPLDAPLLPPHPRALGRAVLLRLLRSAALAGVLVAAFQPWGWLAVALIPLALPAAWLEWKTQGWRVTDHAVVSRRGLLQRSTWVLARDKIQSVQVRQPVLMRWAGLGRVVVRVAGSAVALPDLGLDECHRLMHALGGRPPDGGRR